MSQSLPTGCPTLTPHLIVNDGPAAIEYYKKAFGAVEESRLVMPGTNMLMHAGLRIGDSVLMLSGEFGEGECGGKSPLSLGGSAVTIHFYVDNVDQAFQKAIDAGAQQIMEPMDMFWGDRYGKLKDPFGHEWSLATKIKDLTPEQIMAAAQECFSQAPQPVN